MAETFSIQATLTARDELSPVLDQIAKNVAKLEGVFRDLSGAKIFDAIVKDARKAIDAISKVRAAADKLGEPHSLAPVATAIKAIATAAHEAAEEQKALNEALGSAPKPGTEAGKADPRAELAKARAERGETYNQKGEALKGFGEQLKGLGEGLQSGLERIYEAGAEFQGAMATFRGLGLGDKDNAEAEKFVAETKLTG